MSVNTFRPVHGSTSITDRSSGIHAFSAAATPDGTQNILVDERYSISIATEADPANAGVTPTVEAAPTEAEAPPTTKKGATKKDAKKSAKAAAAPVMEVAVETGSSAPFL